MPTVALVDCQNFYVSCERVFDPSLRERPVAVLSNNDGCIIARSEEVKAAGVPMGAPYFKWDERLDAMGAAVLSSNYALYGDMSRRVTSLLEEVALELAPYSIDESFLLLPDRAEGELEQLAQSTRARILRGTGIPVRFGIGPTKTLAKLASYWAKKEPCGYLVFPKGESQRKRAERESLLGRTPAGEVWGIGSAYERHLKERGVTTARGLRDLPNAWLRSKLSIRGLRTALELRGRACRPLDESPDTRKTLIRSRSFGRRVTKERALREAVLTHVSRAAEKLRTEALEARGLRVFITTKRFGDRPHYGNAAGGLLPCHTSSTTRLGRAARRLLDTIYRSGYGYKKAGVMLYALRPAETPKQEHLFDGGTPSEAGALMEAVDAVNDRYGRGTLRLAGSGLGRDWSMQQTRRSPRYTTRWDELPVAHATS